METTSRFVPEYLKRDKDLFTKYLDTYVNKFNGARIGYGTAGFRTAAQYLEHIAFRSGVFASYMAKFYKGHVIGVQITASHNPNQDNGIKFIGKDALMMKTEFEKCVEDFANIEDLNEACKMLEDFFVNQLNNGQPVDWSQDGFILIGCDTRTSSPLLIGALMEAITFAGSKYINFGEVTTPQLHYMVLVFNKKHRQNLPKFDYKSEDLLRTYYEDFGGAIIDAFDLLAEMGLNDKNKKKTVFIDCSNGVGGIHQEKLTEEFFNKVFNVVVLNSRDTPNLNVDCGSEFVQKEKQVPSHLLEYIDKNIPKEQNLDEISFISYDGDADRAVAYRVERGSTYADLFEGDKMGALYALFCQTYLKKITELQNELKGSVDLKEDFSKWSIGAALTAYANGAAQKYYRDTLKVHLMIEPTGVKYLHRAAENFDIGVYFESNGHGTVVYNHDKIHVLEEAVKIAEVFQKGNNDEKALKLYQHLKLLYLFLIEANQGVGDAISNFLQIETALAGLGINATGWKAIYADLENAHSKIVVRNKSVIKVSHDQSRVTTPIAIQDKIDEICAKYNMGRAFIRPSGTEDICRLYVEATTLDDVKAIQKQITEYVLSNKDVN